MHTCPACQREGILAWRRWTLFGRWPTRCVECERLVGVRGHRYGLGITWKSVLLVPVYAAIGWVAAKYLGSLAVSLLVVLIVAATAIGLIRSRSTPLVALEDD